MGFLKKVFNAVTDAAGFVGNAVSSAVKFILPSSAANTSTMSSKNFLTNTLQDLVGSGINYLFNLQGMKDQNKLGQENAKYWAKYNSPIMQMQRLKEAGLNPNLVYGEGANAQFAGNTNNPTMHGINTKYMTSLELASLKADIANKDKTNANLDAQNGLLKSQKRAQDIANREAESRNPELYGSLALKMRDAEFQAQEISNKVNRELARIGVDKEYFLNNTFNQYSYDLTRNLIQEIQYQFIYEKSRLENDVLDADRQLKLKQLDEIEAKIPYWSAQADAARALADNYRSATNLNDKKAIGQSLQNILSFFDGVFGKYGLNGNGPIPTILRPLYRMTMDITDLAGVTSDDAALFDYIKKFEDKFKALGK